MPQNTSYPSVHHRDKETQALIDGLEAHQNIHIYGRRGQGKTHIASLAAQHIQPSTAYINCTKHDTEHKTLTQLHEEIIGETAPNGVSTCDLKERVTSHLTQHNTVILDDIDFHHNPTTTLHWLTDQPQITVTTISTTPDLTETVDPRTTSRLQPYTIHLKDYTPKQTAEILAHWTQKSDTPDATKRALVHLAMNTTNLNYAKTWINTANHHAEDIVTTPAAAKTKTQARTHYEDWLLQDFTPHHHIVLEAIYQLTGPVDRTTSTGDVYEQYRDLCHVLGNDPRTQRRVGTFIDHLNLLDIINVEKHHGGTEGKTRKIRLQKI